MAIVVDLQSNRSVNGIPFGCGERELRARLGAMYGEPHEERYNAADELELVVGPGIFRVFADRFVECTFPDPYPAGGHVRVDGVDVLSIFDWIAACPDAMDKARFRISLAHGIAYDHRDPRHGSITLYEAGRWDELAAIEL